VTPCSLLGACLNTHKTTGVTSRKKADYLNSHNRHHIVNVSLNTYLIISAITFYIYVRGSVHRNSRLEKRNEMQQYADIYLLLNYSTCFGRPSRPSLGVHKTVVAGSGTKVVTTTTTAKCRII